MNSLPLKFHRLTGRKQVTKQNFWKELEQFVRESKKENLKLEEKNMVLEAQLSSAQDDIEKLEKAVLELSIVYDQLVDRNTKLVAENKQIFEKLMSFPFNQEGVRDIELSVSSVADTVLTRKSSNKCELIEEESNN